MIGKIPKTYVDRLLHYLAVKSREPDDERSGQGRRSMDESPVVRLIAVNRTEEEFMPPIIG